ncbi:hypothetical protein BGZ60DRAFT_264094 [Tricladium varicosporioides]|nr:hypothetical protein BGZ60DRAFT_264094 [Hymenoscyphus varicosporioides]
MQWQRPTRFRFNGGSGHVLCSIVTAIRDTGRTVNYTAEACGSGSVQRQPHQPIPFASLCIVGVEPCKGCRVSVAFFKAQAPAKQSATNATIGDQTRLRNALHSCFYGPYSAANHYKDVNTSFSRHFVSSQVPFPPALKHIFLSFLQSYR